MLRLAAGSTWLQVLRRLAGVAAHVWGCSPRCAEGLDGESGVW